MEIVNWSIIGGIVFTFLGMKDIDQGMTSLFLTQIQGYGTGAGLGIIFLLLRNRQKKINVSEKIKNPDHMNKKELVWIEIAKMIFGVVFFGIFFTFLYVFIFPGSLPDKRYLSVLFRCLGNNAAAIALYYAL